MDKYICVHRKEMTPTPRPDRLVVCVHINHVYCCITLAVKYMKKVVVTYVCSLSSGAVTVAVI